MWVFQGAGLDWFLFSLGLVLFAHYRLRKRYRYFEEKCVPHVRPTFLLGNTFNALTGKETMSECFHKIYERMKGKKFCGFFQFTKPCILLRDPGLIRRFLVQDFVHFQDHGIRVDAKTNPLEGSLFNLRGKEWRGVRRVLSPAFSTAKLRWMADQLEASAESLVRALLDNGEVELKGICSRFTADVVASSAFGLKSNALEDPSSEFHRMMDLVFKPSLMRTLRMLFRFSLPQLYFKLRIKTIRKEVEEFFLRLLSTTFRTRSTEGGKRRDLAQLLWELKEKGEIQLEAGNREEKREVMEYQTESDEKIEMTDALLAAQAFGFYTGGVETTSSTLSFVLYELAKNPQAQDKLRKEVLDGILQTKESNIYDAVAKMEYLDAVVSETLRLHSPTQMLLRECTKSLSLVEGLEVEAGTPVVIPVHSLHADPVHFPSPGDFLPERFIGGLAAPRGAYLPFGDGPRICIGRRLALFVIKMALVKVVAKFRLEESPKMPENLEYQRNSFLLSPPQGGLWARLVEIQPSEAENARG